MTPIHVITEITEPMVDASELAGEGMVTDIGLLRHGTSTGRASVAVVITLPDGQKVLGQTTWRLLDTAARALAASPVAREEPRD